MDDFGFLIDDIIGSPARVDLESDRILNARALGVQDVKTALAAQKELSKTLDLYRGDPIDPQEADEGRHAMQQLRAVRAYLDPLELGDNSVDTAELTRRAVAELTK